MPVALRMIQGGLIAAVLLAGAGCARRTIASAPAPPPSATVAPNVPFSIEVPRVARAGPATLYPDPALTPGFTNPNISQSNIAANICNRNWSTSSIRPPVSYTDALKVQQMAQYHDTVPDSRKNCVPNSNRTACYEEDHLISLEDGGNPTDPRNLWPEPYNTMIAGVVVGARQKDEVESFVHDEICFDIPNHKTSSKIPARISITLARGQEILATDWYACYVAIQNRQDCL